MKAYYQGQRDLQLPRILGHEVVGTIAGLGKDIYQFNLGDRVQIAPGLPCGCCRYCLTGTHQMCDHIRTIGFHYDGGFAEYVLIPPEGVTHGVLNKIPNDLTFNEATLAEPLACSINMQKSLQIKIGDAVVIFGLGPLGIINTKLARAMGARLIIGVEINISRFKQAEAWGIDYPINSLKTDPVSEILRITRGNGVDVVIPCCSSHEVISQGLAVLSKKGRFGLFSGLSHPHLALIDVNTIHYKELVICGAYGCSAKDNRDAIELLSSGVIKVNDMITRVVGLEEIVLGIEAIKKMEEIKIIIEP